MNPTITIKGKFRKKEEEIIRLVINIDLIHGLNLHLQTLNLSTTLLISTYS